MEAVAISWLVASACSPLIAVLALWTVYVFHTYRKRWRTVDLFLLAVASEELISAVFTFSYAIVSLINPPINTLCSFIQWGLISTRTFQIATLTSMVVDRALTVRWPYRYRFSVRRNQIRYHIAVLALMSILVGVAAVFAHVPDSSGGMRCSGHPMKWDFKFVVFVLGFYGALLLLSLICTIQIEIHKCRNGGKHQSKGMPYQLPDCSSSELPVTASITSPLDNESHTGSTRALHRPYRHSSRRPYGKKASGASDFRWPPVAVVSLVCFSVNHLPYLVLTSLATALPWIWSPWHEAMLSWLRLAEGVLVPIILCLVDHPVRAALKRTFQRRSGALSPLVGDDGPFQMYFDKDHFRKRGTFGSVTPIGIITNYRRTPGKKRRNRKCKYKLPGLQSGDSIIEKSCLSSNFLSSEPLSKLSCADLTSLEVWQEEDEENFYATLSDDISTFSCNSTDINALDDEAKICDDIYGGSFTTIANDDFEFHDTRPCGGEVRMRPSLTVDVPPTSSFRSSINRGSTTKEKREKEDVCPAISSEKEKDLMNVIFQSEEEEKKDPNIFQTAEKRAPEQYKEPDVVKTVGDSNQAPPSLSKMKNPWFSMNDLDLIDKDGGSPQDRIYVLPIKSESTMSLYRLRLDKEIEQLLPASQLENNINDDSGFGSATQTVDPVWPGYIFRKTSDPLSNQSNPVVLPGNGSNKHYPCVLHPRMQKLPWISAWKKLGGRSSFVGKQNSKQEKGSDSRNANKDSTCGVLLINDNFHLRPKEHFQWKDSIVYSREESRGRTGSTSKQARDTFDETQLRDSNFPYHINVESAIYEPVRRTNKDESSSRAHCSEKKRCSRKNSFQSTINKDENPYGKINDHKVNSDENFAENRSTVNASPEENIYEEIISRTPRNDERRKVAKSRLFEDKSYAQTDILNFGAGNGNDYNERNNNAESKRRTHDSNLNANIGSTSERTPARSESFHKSDHITTDLRGKYPSDAIVNGYNHEVNYIRTLDNKEISENQNFQMGSYNNNNGLNVAFSVNENILEFFDSRDHVAESLALQDARHTANVRYLDEDLEPERKCEQNMKKQRTVNISPNCRMEPLLSGKKEGHVKRRDSKNGKSDFKALDTSDVTELPYFKRSDNLPVARKDSDARKKQREIRRRGSNGKDNREVLIGRKESDHRGKRLKSDSIFPENVLSKKKDAVVFQRHTGLWPKESVDFLGSSNKNYEPGRVHNGPHGEKVVSANNYNGCDDLACSGTKHPSPNLSNAAENDTAYLNEKRNDNDLFRLRSKHIPNTSIVNGDHQDFSEIPAPGRNRDIIRPRIHVRNSDLVNAGDYFQVQRREDSVGISRSNSKEKRGERPKRKQDIERRESGSKVKRRVSGSRDRRPSHDFEGKGHSSGSGEKRINRMDSMNNVKRRNSFLDADEANLNVNGTSSDVNRNESVKLNMEPTNIVEENNRMDNLLYGRRDNVNLPHESEIFPFETFVKPPPYNVIRHHVADRSVVDFKDRYRQKKIAITDFL